jgi:hypothetical protein
MAPMTIHRQNGKNGMKKLPSHQILPFKGHSNARGEGPHRCHAHFEPKEADYSAGGPESAMDLCKLYAKENRKWAILTGPKPCGFDDASPRYGGLLAQVQRQTKVEGLLNAKIYR